MAIRHSHAENYNPDACTSSLKVSTICLLPKLLGCTDAASKYIETPYGTFLLKDFFSDAYSKEDGTTISTKVVKSHLQEIIEKEDKKKPFSDDELSEKLGEKGYHIARRTVAKYREQLHFPVARLRRML